MTVSLAVYDGNDDIVDAGERKLSSSIKIDWSSDGENVTLTVPAQTQTVRFEQGSTILQATFGNAAEDVFTLRQDSGFGNYPATLEVRVLSFFDFNTGSIPIAQYFEREGDYFLKVDVDQGGDEVMFYRGQAFDTVEVLANVVDVEEPIVDGFNVQYPEGAPQASNYPIALVEPADPSNPGEVIDLHPLLYGETLEFDFGVEQSLDADALNSLVSGGADPSEVPQLLLNLDQVPFGAGLLGVTVTLTDGTDAIRDTGERQLTGMVDLSWEADGEGANFIVGEQTAPSLIVSYTDDLLDIDTELTNFEQDILSLNGAGVDYPASLTMKLVNFFNVNFAGVDIEFVSYFGAGNYHLSIDLDYDEGPQIYYQGLPINRVEGVIRVESLAP